MDKPLEKEPKEDLSKFNYIFKWNRILLGFLGIWPLQTTKPSIFGSIGTALWTFLIATVSVTQFADLIVIWGQFDPMIDNLSVNLIVILSIVKLVTVRVNFRRFQYCLNQARDDWRVDHGSKYLQAMLRRAKIGRTFSIASPILAIGTAVCYSIRPLTFKKPENSTEIFAPFPFRAAYFFDPSSTPIYQILYLIQTSACYSATIAHSAIDSFFAALALHACGQLDVFGQKLRAIGSEKPMSRDLVVRHLQLIKFVETLGSLYPFIILGQLLISSLVICGVGYKCIMSLNDGDLSEAATFSFFTVAMLMIIYLYCYAGQCLIDESTRLTEAAYSCRWYEMNPSDAKAVQLVLLRAQKPLHITAANFVIMSHESFADILRRSAAYLSVLQAVKASM